ncbi:MAG TPA: hypothetical protein VM492_00735 [Sumerlaeia bacterium]|nr:hypothetical protein [Sumerlaeia bacterium]
MNRVWAVVAAALIICGPPEAQAVERTDCSNFVGMKIYAEESAVQYLGLITPGRNHPESIVNPHGDYGSSTSLTSIRNPNCKYGTSEYGVEGHDLSAFYHDAQSPPFIVSAADGKKAAVLTVGSIWVSREDDVVNPAT